MKIEVKNLTKTIKTNEVLKNVNLYFESGKVYGIYGRNGSGKTMLMRSICGLIKPTDGEISIDGLHIGKEIDFPSSLGVIIETPGFYKYYTGFENLKMLADIKGIIGDKDIKDAITRVGLNPEDERTVGKYSLGMRQRLAIAQAIMESPELLILDEPTNALDDEGIEMFHQLILDEKKKGKLVILASHNQEDISILADVKIHMNAGQATITEE